MSKFLSVFLLVVLIIPYSGADNHRYPGLNIPPKIVVDKNNLYLSGVAARTSGGRVDYVLALYLDQKNLSSDEVLTNKGSKRAKLYFVENISFVRARRILYDDLLINTEPELFERIAKQLKALTELAPRTGFKKDSWGAFDYVPGRGTVFLTEYGEGGVFEGEDLYQALLMQWIGPRPFTRKFKHDLLGGSQ